jgi:hypothetical protein
MNIARLLAAVTIMICCYLTAVHPAYSQSNAAPAQAAPPPAANPADVSSVDAIMKAIYDVISGPAGKKRDWDRFRSLFLPGARLAATRTQQDGSGLTMNPFTPDDYATRAAARLETDGFFEHEVSRKTEAWGNIQQIFSTYESRHNAHDAKPFARGINSFQLFNDGKRWWIVTIMWQQESPANPIPPEFLSGQKK